MLLLSIIVPLYFPKRRLSNKIVLSGFLLVIMFLVPIANYSYYFSRIEGSVGQREAYWLAISEIKEMPLQETIEYGKGQIVARFDYLSDIIAIQAKHPKIWPFYQGETIWNEMKLGMVPRAFWPEKPIITISTWFSEVYLDAPWSAAAMHPFGELYMNFGYIGVFTGMVMIGFLLRLLWEWSRAGGEWPPIHVMFYGMILGIVVHSAEGTFLELFIGLPRILFFVILMNAILIFVDRRVVHSIAK